MNNDPVKTSLMRGKVPNIMVFDSGVGGLSIASAIRERLPFCNQVFACDNAAFPYGTKDETTLLHRVDTTLQTLIADQQPDIVVVACNTASTLVLPRIRSRFTIPVVGVVPAIKPAAERSQSGVIGLLGTPGTVARPYTDKLIRRFADNCTVLKIGSSELVKLAEAAVRGSRPDRSAVKEIISPFFQHPDLDTIVLACTHFPLLIDDLKENASRAVSWIDSGEAIARRVGSLLLSEAGGVANLNKAHLTEKGYLKAIFTSYDQKYEIESLSAALTSLHYTDIRYLPIDAHVSKLVINPR